MDNSKNDNTQRANKLDELHDILRTFVDDPINEVKTYCVSPFIQLESVESVLKNIRVLSLFSVWTSKALIANWFLYVNIVSSQWQWYSLSGHLPPGNLAFPWSRHLPLQYCGLSFNTSRKSCSNHSGLVIYLSDKFSFSVKDTLPGFELWVGLFCWCLRWKLMRQFNDLEHLSTT